MSIIFAFLNRVTAFVAVIHALVMHFRPMVCFVAVSYVAPFKYKTTTRDVTCASHL